MPTTNGKVKGRGKKGGLVSHETEQIFVSFCTYAELRSLSFLESRFVNVFYGQRDILAVCHTHMVRVKYTKKVFIYTLDFWREKSKLFGLDLKWKICVI